MSPFDEDPSENRSELELCIDEIHQLQAELDKEIKQLEESDAWMIKAKEASEGGMCSECFATDEAGHKEGCYILELENKSEQLEAENERLKEGLEDIRDGTTDRDPPFRAMGATQMRDVAIKALESEGDKEGDDE